MRRRVMLATLGALWLAIVMAAIVWATVEYLIVLEPGEHVDIVCTSDVYSVAPHGDGVRFGCFEPVPPCEPFPSPDDCTDGGVGYPVYLPIVESDDGTDK